MEKAKCKVCSKEIGNKTKTGMCRAHVNWKNCTDCEELSSMERCFKCYTKVAHVISKEIGCLI